MSHGLLIDANYEKCMDAALSLLESRKGVDSAVNHKPTEFIEFMLALAEKCRGLLSPHTIIMKKPYEALLRQCLLSHGMMLPTDHVDEVEAVRGCINNKMPKTPPATIEENAKLYRAMVMDCLIPVINCEHSTGAEFGLARSSGQPG